MLELVEVATVCPRFCWSRGICKHIEIAADNLFQGLDQGKQVSRHRNLPDGVFGLGLVHDDFRVFLFLVYQINPLKSLANPENTRSDIHVIPLEGTDFADTETGAKANVDSQVEKGKMILDKGHKLPLMSESQNFKVLFLSVGRKYDINLMAGQ